MDFKTKINWRVKGFDMSIRNFSVKFTSEKACEVYENFTGEHVTVGDTIIMSPNQYDAFEEAAAIGGCIHEKS